MCKTKKEIPVFETFGVVPTPEHMETYWKDYEESNQKPWVYNTIECDWLTIEYRPKDVAFIAPPSDIEGTRKFVIEGVYMTTLRHDYTITVIQE